MTEEEEEASSYVSSKAHVPPSRVSSSFIHILPHRPDPAKRKMSALLDVAARVTVEQELEAHIVHCTDVDEVSMGVACPWGPPTWSSPSSWCAFTVIVFAEADLRTLGSDGRYCNMARDLLGGSTARRCALDMCDHLSCQPCSLPSSLRVTRSMRDLKSTQSRILSGADSLLIHTLKSRMSEKE